MKIKKITSMVLALVMIFGICVIGVLGGFADIEEGLYYAEIRFRDGVGPETNGYTLDYKYFSPVKSGDTTKYPLVVWLHGMGNGYEPGDQLSANDIEAWATEELQGRFKDSGGAFILAPRSLEENYMYWEECLVFPLRATIDAFIAENKENIDLSRIYIGGYSIGGRMTLKMAVAYPEMFAAAFPICPAWVPDKESAAQIADMPIWITTGKNDQLMNYNIIVKRAWENIVAESNVPLKCRFSTMSKTVYPDGSAAPSGHHAWFAVNYDMFSSTDGNYPQMETVDGKGNIIALTYPDGMISWLSSKTSDYDGIPASDRGNLETSTIRIGFIQKIVRLIERLFVVIFIG